MGMFLENPIGGPVSLYIMDEPKIQSENLCPKCLTKPIKSVM